ncbi:hypothetical protein [Nostoc sp.]|uniref:hypothetical protein n=1 Tax=Nostoc sp. TaxID=1180 RepID=UPI002FF9C460
MVKRSLQASLTGIQEAKRAFALKGWIQDNLAAEVNLKTRQPIWRFFSGRLFWMLDFINLCNNSRTNFPILVKVKNGLNCGGRRTIQSWLNS